MNRFSAVVLTAVVLVLAMGCGGGGGVGIKEGDKLEVVQNLEREKFDASYGENVKSISHTNSGFIEIPEGTVLEVFVTPRKEARTIECRPIKVGEITDADEIRDRFVPERYRTDGFLYYTISLDASYLGSKVKKVE